jgi:hypothetical protein
MIAAWAGNEAQQLEVDSNAMPQILCRRELQVLQDQAFSERFNT